MLFKIVIQETVFSIFERLCAWRDSSGTFSFCYGIYMKFPFHIRFAPDLKRPKGLPFDCIIDFTGTTKVYEAKRSILGKFIRYCAIFIGNVFTEGYHQSFRMIWTFSFFFWHFAIFPEPYKF